MEQKCSICGGTQFEKKDGRFFCKICGEEFEGIIEEWQLNKEIIKKPESVTPKKQYAIQVWSIETGYEDGGWHRGHDRVDGVSVRFSYRNLSDKTIKYITFSFIPINTVGDYTSCTVTGESLKAVKDTGPVEHNKSKYNVLFKTAWYNQTIEKAELRSVQIIYMDNSMLTVNKEDIYIGMDNPNIEIKANQNQSMNSNSINYSAQDLKFTFRYGSIQTFVLKEYSVMRIYKGEVTELAYSDISSIKFEKETINYKIIIHDKNSEFILLFAEFNDRATLQSFMKSLVSRVKGSGNVLCQYTGINGNGEFSGGCYVATCVYGSYDCPQVWTLRRYRDDKLAKTWFGRAFIRTYYAISPTLVKWFGKTKWFKRLWKGKLDKMVSKLQEQGFKDTPYEDKNWQ